MLLVFPCAGENSAVHLVHVLLDNSNLAGSENINDRSVSGDLSISNGESVIPRLPCRASLKGH